MNTRLIRVALSVTLVLAACAPESDLQDEEPTTFPSSESNLWAIEAEAFMSGFMESFTSAHPATFVDYYSPEASVSAGDGHVYTGLAEIQAWVTEVGDDPELRLEPGPLFLDSEGLAGAALLWLGEESGCPPDPGLCALPTVSLLRMGDQGIFQHVTAFPTATLRQQTSGTNEETSAALDDLLTALDVFYLRYAETWTVPDQHPMAGIYDALASRTDALFGVETIGIDQMTEVAIESTAPSPAYGPLVPIAIDQLLPGPFDGPAVFANLDQFAREGVQYWAWGFYQTEGRCPVTTMIEWELGADRVVAERLWYEVDSLRKCQADAVVLPDGWWSNLQTSGVPAPIQTGSINVNGAAIAVFNSTKALDRLLSWGLNRFDQAGLEVPTPASVTFPPVAGCRKASGLAHVSETGGNIDLCFTETEACDVSPSCAVPTRRARITTLHELAHVWTAQNLDQGQIDEFLTFRGLTDWTGADLGWYERGIEHAAEIMAWGLLDEAVAPVRLPDRDCARLTAAYRILTDRDPLGDCVARRG